MGRGVREEKQAEQSSLSSISHSLQSLTVLAGLSVQCVLVCVEDPYAPRSRY